MQCFGSQQFWLYALCMGVVTEVIMKCASFIEFLQTDVHVECSYVGL